MDTLSFDYILLLVYDRFQFWWLVVYVVFVVNNLRSTDQLSYFLFFGTRFHPIPDLVRDSDPKSIETIIDHHKSPRMEHRLTKVKAHPGLTSSRAPSLEESIQKVQESKTLKAIVKTLDPRSKSCHCYDSPEKPIKEGGAKSKCRILES